MTKRIVFKPQLSDQLKKSGKYDVWATIHYTMFPEMEGEFSKTDERYKAKRIVKLDADEDENNQWEYEKYLEYPWGDLKIEARYTDRLVDDFGRQENKLRFAASFDYNF